MNGPTKINEKPHDITFRFVASPLVIPGLIVIPTCKKGPSLAINVTDALQGDVTNKPGVIRWMNEVTPDVSIPVADNGLAYMLHTDGKLQCIDIESGKEVYFERTHTVQHRASPLLADGHLYLCGKDGRCTVVKTGREFSIVSSNDLGEPITASPVVAGGVLYLRTYDALYAIK